MKRGGTSKGALAALGLAGLVWAYKNRDQISAKLSEFRNQLPNSSSSASQSHTRSIESQTDFPPQSQFGENYNKNI